MSSSTKVAQKVRILMVNDVYTFHPLHHEGGFSSLATMLKDYNTDDSLFFLTGDFLGGSHLTAFCEGKSSIEVMNLLNLDGVVIGNHEFDYGPEAVIERIKESNFPWLGANVVDNRTGELLKGLLPSMMKTVSIGKNQTIKVGLFGVCTTHTPHLAYPGPHMVFEDVIPVARKMVQQLREQGADLIVGLTHLRIAQDTQLAREVKGIDVILGGHDHSPFQQFVGTTFIMKCGQNAEWLGVLDLEVEKISKEDEDEIGEEEGKNAYSPKYHFFPSYSLVKNRHYVEDEKVTSVIAKYEVMAEKEQAAVNHDEVLATIVGPVALSSKTEECRFHHSPFGQIIADAMVHVYNEFGQGPLVTELKTHHSDVKVDFGIINGGFIRGNKFYRPQYQFTLRDCLFVELPFPKEAVILNMLGKDIVEALEQMLSLSPSSNAAFPHVSKSLHVEYEPYQPVGQRIKLITVNEKPLEMSERYNVVVSMFMAIGGDGCVAWKRHKRLSKTGQEPRIQHAFADYLREMKELNVADYATARVVTLHE